MEKHVFRTGAEVGPYIERNKPTIIVEVLPESEKLAALISSMAKKNRYTINIVPAYGNDTIRTEVAYPDGP